MVNLPSKDKLPLVLVEWHDAWTNELGVTVEDVGASHGPMVVHTLGWLLKDNRDAPLPEGTWIQPEGISENPPKGAKIDKRGVSLANEYFDDQYRGRTFIPRAMVARVTVMRLSVQGKPRKTKAPHVEQRSEA